eukprot:gene9174-6452_t
MIAEKTDFAARGEYDAARALKIDSEEHLKQAFRHLNACLDIKPTFLGALLLRANIAGKSRNYAVAVADLSLAIQVLTGGLTVDKKRLASVYGSRAGIYVKQRKFQEGLLDLQKAIDIEGDNGAWLYEMGKVYLAQGNQSFAQYYFQACLNDKVFRISDAVKFKALSSLGMCRLSNGDTCGALTTFMKAKELNDTADLRNYMGLSSYRAGYFTSAVEHFKRAVEMNRNCLEYHFNLAVSYYRTKDLNNALQHFTTATLHGESAELLYFRGLVQLALGLYIHALVDFDQAIHLDSQSRFHYAKTLLFMAQAKMDDAEISCRKALELAPQSRRCLAHSGMIAHYRGDLHTAVKMLHAALEIEPKDVILVERLGLAYTDLGFHDTAVRFFERCCTLSPSGRYFFRKAVAQLCSGDIWGGYRSICTALEEHEYESPMSFHVRSVALKKLGRLEEALNWATRSIMRNPKHYKFFLNRAEIHYDLHQFTECIADVDSLLKIRNTAGEAFYLRGRAHHAVGQSPAAAKDFEKAAELIPALRENESYHFCCGVVYANSGKWEEARKSLTEAIACSKGPRTTLYRHERAKVYQNLGQAPKAVEDLSIVIQAEPKNLRAILRRCFSLKVIGEFEAAARDWKTAKKLDTEGILRGYDICTLKSMHTLEFSPIFEEEQGPNPEVFRVYSAWADDCGMVLSILRYGLLTCVVSCLVLSAFFAPRTHLFTKTLTLNTFGFIYLYIYIYIYIYIYLYPSRFLPDRLCVPHSVGNNSMRRQLLAPLRTGSAARAAAALLCSTVFEDRACQSSGALITYSRSVGSTAASPLPPAPPLGFSLKTPFEETLQRLFKTPALRVDLTPVKRPLMEGSVWYDVGKMKVSLVSGVCANSREDVEAKLKERAELLAAQLSVSQDIPNNKEGSLIAVIQHVLGKGLPQLLNHLDIQLNIKFSLVSDAFGAPSSPASTSGGWAPRFHCLMYAREAWESQMQWTLLAKATQGETAVNGASLVAALKHAAGMVELALQKKREAHYFESMREAELLLRDVSSCPVLAGALPTRVLRPVCLSSAIVQSSRGVPLLLKVTVRDEHENETSCGIPLSGGTYVVVGDKMHIAINHQYSSIGDDSEVEEVPLRPPEVSADPGSEPSGSSCVPPSSLPTPQRIIRHVLTLLPALWYEHSGLCTRTDLHQSAPPFRRATSLGIATNALRGPFACAMPVLAGSAVFHSWLDDYEAATGTAFSRPSLVNMPYTSKNAEKLEEKMAFLVGWRYAPVLHTIAAASLIAFVVSDTKRHFYALSTVFESMEELWRAVSGADEVVCHGRGNRKENAAPRESVEEHKDTGVDDASAMLIPCTLEILDVEDILKSLGVVSGVFDQQTSTVELTLRDDGKGGQQRQLKFSQLNEVAGIVRLFRFCHNSPAHIRYQSVRMDTAGSTYCRRVQRLLTLVLRKGQFNKPGLRGKLLPIPVPFTTNFVVMPFTSNLQREVFSMSLLTAIEPFCKVPEDYPPFVWPASPLPQPCFFNFWGPTKSLLQRMGPYYYCFITSNLTKDGTGPLTDATQKGTEAGQPPFTLLLYPGTTLVEDEALSHRIPLPCRKASELPLAVLQALDQTVHELQGSQTSPPRKSQDERLQKILCERGVPREITLSNPHYWPKVVRLLFDSQEFYVRHQNEFKLLLEIVPNQKPAELASVEVTPKSDDAWKNELASQYVHTNLMPFLEPVALLCSRSVAALEKIPAPGTSAQLKFFTINIRPDLKLRNYHASLSAGSSTFRKDTIQGLPSSTPTAALEALLSEIDETDDAVLKQLGQKVYEEITSGSNNSPTVIKENASSSKLICSLELSAAQKTLSPYLIDAQKAVTKKMDIRTVSHQYQWGTRRLALLGTPPRANEPPIEIASQECEWDEIPIVLPQLYASVIHEASRPAKSEADVQRAMTKGAVAMLEHEVRSRIVPVIGTEKLFQNIRLVQVQGEMMWYAELKLPAGLLKVEWVGEPPPPVAPKGPRNDTEQYKHFYICSSTNTKRGALRKLLVELYALYVRGPRSSGKASLIGGRAPSHPLVVDKKPVKILSRDGSSASKQSATGAAGKANMFPPFMRGAGATPGARQNAPRPAGGSASSGATAKPAEPKKASSGFGLPPGSTPRKPARSNKEGKPTPAVSSDPPTPPAPTLWPRKEGTVQRGLPSTPQFPRGAVVVPRKVVGAVRRPAAPAAAAESSPAQPLNKQKSLSAALRRHLEVSAQVPETSSRRCVLHLEEEHGVRLLLKGHAGRGVEHLVAQEAWNPAMWPPQQLLKVLVAGVMRAEEKKMNATRQSRAELLQSLSNTVEPPITVLTPSMQAKQFCVFFFHRYFGWPACDADDVAHLAAHRSGGVLLIADCKQRPRRSGTPPRWEGQIQLAQVHSDTLKILFSKVIAVSSGMGAPEEAITSAWEACMMTIISSFGFDHHTNIYQYTSLDKAYLVCRTDTTQISFLCTEFNTPPFPSFTKWVTPQLLPPTVMYFLCVLFESFVRFCSCAVSYLWGMCVGTKATSLSLYQEYACSQEESVDLCRTFRPKDMSFQSRTSEFEDVELDDEFMEHHLCSHSSSLVEDLEKGVSQGRLLAVCDEFVEAFLVQRWESLTALDKSILECLRVLNNVQTVLEDFIKQLEAIQGEMGDVREQLTQTTIRLANNKMAESVLWGVISQLLVPPEIVQLLTKASEERLGEQYRTGLQLLLRYLQYRRSTWKAMSGEQGRPTAHSESSASPFPRPEGESREAHQEKALREVRISFKNCKPYFELVRVLDNVTVLACVKIKHFLSQQLKVLSVPNTNICIQQEHSLKDHAFYVYFLKYSPGLLRHALNTGAEGERQATLIPYRIVRSLYREFRAEYCSTLAGVYLQKFKSYVFDCNALEISTAATRSTAIFSSAPAKGNGSSSPFYVLPQLSDMVAAVSGVGPWSLGDRGSTLFYLLASPLIPAVEKMQQRKHSYEETLRSTFRLLCDVVTHEYLFSFQLFCGDATVFHDTFAPIMDFLLSYISEIILKERQGDVTRMLKERWDTSVHAQAVEDSYGLLLLVRLCHDFSFFMHHERRLSCLDGFFYAVLQLVWPAFQNTYEPQRTALRCVAPSSLAACLAGPSSASLKHKVSVVHPMVKSLVEYSSNLLAMVLGSKGIGTVPLDEGPPNEGQISGQEVNGEAPDHPAVSRSIRERACAVLDAEGDHNPLQTTRTYFSSLLSNMALLRAEAFLRLDELATFWIQKEKTLSPQDADLFRSALLLNNAHYMYFSLSQARIILSEDEYRQQQLHSGAEDIVVASRSQLHDLQQCYDVYKRKFIGNTIRKHLCELLSVAGETAQDAAEPADPPPVEPLQVWHAAEKFAAQWQQRLNGIRDTVHALVGDPLNQKDLVAQACMESLLLNKRFHDTANRYANQQPESFRGRPLHTFLISNQKMLVHMRSFSVMAVSPPLSTLRYCYLFIFPFTTPVPNRLLFFGSPLLYRFISIAKEFSRERVRRSL